MPIRNKGKTKKRSYVGYKYTHATYLKSTIETIFITDIFLFQRIAYNSRGAVVYLK